MAKNNHNRQPKRGRRKNYKCNKPGQAAWLCWNLKHCWLTPTLQANSTTGLGFDLRNVQQSLYDCMVNDVLANDVILESDTPNLKVLAFPI